MRFTRKYNYQRAKCEDLTIICKWFTLMHNIKVKYSIKIAGVASFVITRRPFATLRGAPFLTFAPGNFGVGY